MITLPPYIPEWMAYPDVPHEHRWIFNKLELCHRFGYEGYPTGCKIPAGVWCVRPIMNITGMGSGGFKRVVLDKPDWIQKPTGHIVTRWTDAFRSWHLYVNDVPFSSQTTIEFDGEIETMIEHDPTFPMPRELMGISRYMLIETLGDTIIDIGPRHMVEEMKQPVIDDYRQFDPDYQPPEYGQWGFQPKMKRSWSDDLQAWTHEEVPNG